MTNKESGTGGGAKVEHQWAATGVSGYPLAHPIVGQGAFYETFRHFIHLVDNEAEQFAHVFAMIAQWGVGKSRLGYELISQLNNTSPGWWVRKDDGTLAQAELFNDDADRNQYLGLYIRYSQVANDYHNVDNWFAYGLYKALLPLAKGHFDGSIQGQIAKEAYDRLIVKGFEESKLAEALEVSAAHSDETLYEDPDLATRLCQAAYAYLESFGIKYVLVVLDELETAAEAATYGLEVSDIKHLDGRAIKLMGKAIKEEDPRRKLPWLRYVALCSPAIGDELREVQSTARRFELTELQANAFSDVSDFVRTLEEDGRLGETYPAGLVEAAYAMSGGNFGWFNVIMANVDGALRQRRQRGETAVPSVGALFDELVRVSSRIREYVLDHNAIDALKLDDRAQLDSARELLYGQLPVPVSRYGESERETLLKARNEYDEPMALQFRRVEWDDLEASEALRASKFTRDKQAWRFAGVDQPLDLRQLLSNLGTYAIHETQGVRRTDGKHTLLIPIRQADFVQLVGLLYPHPASEDAARALWKKFLGTADIDPEDATHIGPSVAMIARLDLRHRTQGQSALVFRDPEQSAAHEKALTDRKAQPERERSREVLVGVMRVLDNNWAYQSVSPGFGDKDPMAIVTAPKGRAADSGGLVSLDALKLHPRGRLVLAWVRNEKELERLCDVASGQFGTEGRTPVLAFTSSRNLVDTFEGASSDKLKNAGSYLMLCQLTASEEHALRQVGIPGSDCKGFRLDGHGFTTAFNNRLQGLARPLREQAGEWRRDLNAQGRIAWPLRPSGRLKDEEKKTLFDAWRFLMIEKDPPGALADLDDKSPVDIDDLTQLLPKLSITPKARAAGYTEEECAGLFSPLNDRAEPHVPPFLLGIIARLYGGQAWTFEAAQREWFWGYTWEAAKPREIFADWLGQACELGFATQEPGKTKASQRYSLRTRNELDNAITEASNWLEGDYRKIVDVMKIVFGEGKVQELFGPEGSAAPGTKTVRARHLLEKAKESVLDLASLEGAGAGGESDDAARSKRFCEAARRRRKALDSVRWVYLRDEYREMQRDENVRTLDFNDDTRPLWARIRRAELFASEARQAESRIRKRVESLSQEMQADLPTGFPIQLFTLSLQKIANILTGALGTEPPATETQVAQTVEPGTLRQHLRDLQVAEAIGQLEKLASELGIDLAQGEEKAMEDIQGQIISGFRELRTSHEQIRTQLLAVAGRTQALEDALNNAPENFSYPAETPSFTNLKNRPAQIEELLDEVSSEDVDELRSTYDGPARLGNFQPLMNGARGLFSTPKSNLQELSGHVRTLENAVSGYRKRLLESEELQAAERATNALRKAQQKAAHASLEMPDLEALVSLRAAADRISEKTDELVAECEAGLADTGVSVERWGRVVASIDHGEDPELESAEAEALVGHGLVERTYRLCGSKE